MIVDAESMELVSAIEEMIEAVPRETEGEVKPELMQSVLEISTDVCRNVGRGGRPARGPAPARARDGRGEGPHDRLRRHPSVRALGGPADRRARRATARSSTRCGFVARQELLFGLHVHVGIDDPEKAIHVANGMRVHLPILLALSTNSPFWRGSADRPDVDPHADLQAASARRHPAALRELGRLPVARSSSWSRPARSRTTRTSGGTCARIPNLGTVEIRVLRRADPARAHGRARRADPGDVQGAGRALRGRLRARHLSRSELLEENKWLAARYGIEGELIDLPQSSRVRGRRAGPAPGRAAAPARARAGLRARVRGRSRT